MPFSENPCTRRELLKLGAAAGWALALSGCESSSAPDPVVTNELRCFNVHPYTDAVMAAQIQALTNMRVNWVRMTLGILSDSAGPYIAAVRANILGLIADFNLGPIDKALWPNMVETVIRRYPSIQYFQILNEPEGFNGIAYREYVLDYLRPAHDLIRQKFPYVKIVSAAPYGQPGGIQDFITMSLAGADQYCDFRAAHIYFDQTVFAPWSAFRRATEKPLMVTETGMSSPTEQVNWWRNQMADMRQILNTDYVFYYVLLDHPVSSGYEVITGSFDARGNIVPATGSGLYDYLRG